MLKLSMRLVKVCPHNLAVTYHSEGPQTATLITAPDPLFPKFSDSDALQGILTYLAEKCSTIQCVDIV